MVLSPGIDIRFQDCVEGMKGMEDGSVDLVCADPPYNIGKSIAGDSNDTATYMSMTVEWLREAVRLLKPAGSIYVMCSVIYQPRIHLVLEDELRMHFLNLIIWSYSHNTHGYKYKLGQTYEPILLFTKSTGGYTFNMDDLRDREKFARYDKNNSVKGKALGDVWEIPVNFAANAYNDIWDVPRILWNNKERIEFYKRNPQGVFVEKAHPTQKPIDLFKQMIYLSSNPGETVLSPFSGSGTCEVACILTGRKCFGFEIDAKRFKKIIEKRIENANKESAELFNKSKHSLDRFND